ncbi:MAG: quinone oxidoreductase [Myxococcota bacterium]
MSHAIRVHAVGGPEVLKWEAVEPPPPGPGEVQLEHRAIGLNFIDVYHRTGLYPLPLPFTPGQEGAGVVTAVGAGVATLQVGQRVAYAGLAGAYAERRNAPAERLVHLPDDVEFATAAAVMLKGMTAEFLLKRCRPVGPGDTIVFHAAAGGVGQLACQWAKHLGARVIGVVGHRDKASLAQAAGCDAVVTLGEEDLVARVQALTGGGGAHVVYDSVGKDTLLASLDCLAPRGMLVSFGQSSGKPPPVELAQLGGLRSLYLTRPSLFAYIATRPELEASAAALFAAIRRGVVKVAPPRTFSLSAAAEAHRALEARETTGSVVLLPGG